MSKVKVDTDPHTKAKLRHSLRRKEEAMLKDARKEASKGRVYRYLHGYYIKDKRRRTTYIYETVPEHKESVQKVTGYVEKTSYWYDEEGYAHKNFRYNIPIYTYETVLCPEKTIVKRRIHDCIKIKPYLRRIHVKKAFYKKMAAKAARKKELTNGSCYKMAYNIDFMLW